MFADQADAAASTRSSRITRGDTRRGLSSTEARDRLLRYERNVLPAGERRGPWRLLREVLTEPMFLLLIVAAGLYVLIGDAAAIVIVWLLAKYGGAGTDELRALAFCALTAGNLLLPWMNSQAAPGLRATPVPALLVVVILTAMLLAAGLAWEPFRALLRFSLPSPSALLAAVASSCAGALIGVWASRPANSAAS